MTFASEVVPWPHRLGSQLQILSELSETLTLRLLDLEERLSLCEGQIGRLDGQHVDGSAVMVDLLEQTEDRLSRLEALLDAAVATTATTQGVPCLEVVPMGSELLIEEPFALEAAVEAPTIGRMDPFAVGLSEELLSSREHVELGSNSFAPEPFHEEEEQAFMDELSG